VVHGDAIDFRELCRRAVPAGTKYLVLDLDRTVHLARNMGELLGWEVAAWHAYGPDHLAAAEPRRGPGRFFLDRRRPLAALRYLAVGARMWAFAGLYYLLFGKLPSRFAAGRRWTFRAFGPDPVAAVQRVPQTALMHLMSDVPSAVLRVLAQRVWDRHACDQVVERADLDWLRARCPGIRIVIASASPEPTVLVAARALGVDDVVFSTVEEHDGWFSAPFQLQPSFWRSAPRRLSAPSRTRINSSRAKIESLKARYPDLDDPATIAVGITDTGYGEDHCWLGHFTTVVDVNSPTPFPPIVDAASPLREIHSAAVLTRREKVRRATGDARYLDPRRPPRAPADVVVTAGERPGPVAAIADDVERLARALDERESGIAPTRERAAERFEAGIARIEELVRSFNEAPAAERPRLLAELRRRLRENRAIRRELARIERPLSEVACSLTRRLADAREAVTGSGTSAA
jgi:hypothetical protein